MSVHAKSASQTSVDKRKAQIYEKCNQKNRDLPFEDYSPLDSAKMRASSASSVITREHQILIKISFELVE